jgi:hypothetical protein
MKTIVRSILVAIFLLVSLVGILSDAVVALTASLPSLPAALIILALVALAGILSDVLAFALVPSPISRPRYFLHAVGVAGIFLVGIVVLGSLTWSAPQVAPGFLSSTTSWPFIVIAIVGFTGYLVDSLIIRPVPAGAVSLPRGLRRYLHDDEQPLCRIQQTRLKEFITPDNLVATDQRLLVHHPTNLGFTSSIQDYNYIDIANIRIDSGWLYSTVSMKERFEGEDMVFEYMPKRGAQEFARIVTNQIQRRQVATTPTQRALPVQAVGDQDAMRILRRRLAAGEITPQQYEELLRKLGD